MAAKIYSAPKEIKAPDLFNSKDWQKDSEKYIADVKAHIKKMGYTGKNAGEVIRFGVADGYAEYMVLSMKPMALIHLAEICDGYQTQFAHLMTAAEVNKMIAADKRMAELFGGKK
jgi:hypothetical protein